MASLQSTSNTNIGTTVYSVQTQSNNNINLQFTPNQVYLTATNSMQYGYLYNIGDLTASQIQISSSNPNLQVTTADQILNGQRVIKVTYELIDTSVPSSGSTVTVTAQSPSGETQTSNGSAELNVNPLTVPSQSTLTLTTSATVTAGAACRNVTITSSPPASSSTQVTINIAPESANSYGFGSSPTSGSFSNTGSCTIPSGSNSCVIGDGNGLCAATGTNGISFTATATASDYSNGTLPVTIAATTPCTNCGIFITNSFTLANGGANLPAVATTLSLGSFTDGFKAGDAICQYYAGQNSYAGTYKALIAGANRQPGGSDWVIYANTSYVRAGSATPIGTSTSGAQLPATLNNSISASVETPVLNGFAYNLNPWVLDTTNGNCSNWTAATPGTWVMFGNPKGTDVYATMSLPPPPAYLANYSTFPTAGPMLVGCDSLTSVLYCVQQ